MNVVESIKHLFLQFGSVWVLWLLFALSAGSLFVCIERWVFFRSRAGDLRRLAQHLEGALRDGAPAEVDAALESLSSEASVAANVARAGLRLAPRGLSAVDKGMQSALTQERKAV